MIKQKRDAMILFLSIPLALLAVWVSYSGIFVHGTYRQETVLYASQGIGQDWVNLFLVVPFLVLSAILAWKGSKTWQLLWSGALFYLAYSFAIYAFSVHFNGLFLGYCAVLGLSLYSLVYFSTTIDQIRYASGPRVPVLNRLIAGYFFGIAGLFALLWLAEVVPASLAGNTPASVRAAGLLTNPVHVLDLAICLPGLVLVGILLLRGLKSGLIWTPALLIFIIAMAAAIVGMTLVMAEKGLDLDIFLLGVFVAVAVVSVVVLVQFLRQWKFSNAAV